MAILESQIRFTGSLGDLSFYRVAGSDKIVVRRKAGPSKKQVQTGDNFAHTRLNNAEFGGRIMACQLILRALHPLRLIANRNIANGLHRPLKAIQEFDIVRRKGRRGICFSQKGTLLEGFSLNTRSTLESIVSNEILCSVTATGEATVHIPELIPGVNLILDERFPYFRLCAVLAAIPDLHMLNKHYASPLTDLQTTRHVSDTTPWLCARSARPAEIRRMVAGPLPSGNEFAWMLSLGVQVGNPVDEDIQPVPKQGAGKVMKVVSASPDHRPGGSDSAFIL